MAGMVILDISDITKPEVVNIHNYHPPFFKTHTYVPMPFPLKGKDVAVAVDEEPPRKAEQNRDRDPNCVELASRLESHVELECGKQQTHCTW